MKIYINILILSLVSTLAQSQVKIFEPGLISDNQSFGLTVSPNGKEIFFVKSFGGRDTLQIFHSIKVKGRWQQPKLAPFADTKFRQIDPSFSPDGKIVLLNILTSNGNNFDIYATNKTSIGWSTPEKLSDSLNTNSSEFYATISKNKNIYFTRRTKSNDIYVSYFIDNKYQNAIKLENPINTDKNESNPYISKNEDYIIFFADYENGFGETDLYISFKKQNKWSNPINLGSEINSKIGEFCPSVDFNNKLFIFSRTEVVNGKRIENIYTYPLRKLRLNKLKKRANWD